MRPNCLPQVRPQATLYIFCGLPGSGKSTLAQRLAVHIGASYLRLDTIEQALRDAYQISVGGEGYRLAYRIAGDNLRLGGDVVADSCNPLALTRREWAAVAGQSGARAVDIEIVCSDPAEHRRRVETRVADIPGLRPPSWSEVIRREYHRWPEPPLTVDTAGKSIDACFAELLLGLGACAGKGPPPDFGARS